MQHNLEDWTQTASFVNGIPILDTTPLTWYNNEGKRLSPDELISMGYWGVRPAKIPSNYDSNVNKIEEKDLRYCERDEDKKVIIKSYNIIDLTDYELSDIQRKKRNYLLKETDKFVYPDLWEDLSQERKNCLKIYRQKLRDVPQQNGFPKNIEWPDISTIYPQDLQINLPLNFTEISSQKLEIS